MAKTRILRFPTGFLQGTATSSHQYEGDNTNNQWYRWEQQGRIRTGEVSGKAANWWERAEDAGTPGPAPSSHQRGRPCARLSPLDAARRF